MNIPDIYGHYRDAPPEELIFFVQGVDIIREDQSPVKEPTVESSAFVSIAHHKIVHLGEVVEEH